MKLIHNSAAQQINYLDQRFYTNDSEHYYPSVTEILQVYPKGFGFNQWLKDVGSNAEDIANRAAETGSKIHNACDALNRGAEVLWADENGNGNFSIDEWKMILRYEEFWKATDADLLCSECSLCSEDLGFGGTLDNVSIINGKRWLIDIKTSNYLHTSHELQLSAYAKMWNTVNSDQPPIDQTGILWLKASTKTAKIDHAKGIYQGQGWQLKTFDRHYNEAYKIFEHTHAIWKEENPVWRPMNQTYPDRLKLNLTSVEA